MFIINKTLSLTQIFSIFFLLTNTIWLVNFFNFRDFTLKLIDFAGSICIQVYFWMIILFVNLIVIKNRLWIRTLLFTVRTKAISIFWTIQISFFLNIIVDFYFFIFILVDILKIGKLGIFTFRACFKIIFSFRSF